MSSEADRAEMVERQLVRRGISDPRVLDAFQHVPREEFLLPELREYAYQDTALPAPEGQTISQPYVVALTAQALGLGGGERVLEVGTGSGYAAAVLGHLAREVYSIERLAGLAADARKRLARLGYHNVQVLLGDGTLGLPKHAPYDAIAVAAGSPDVPKALLEQLAPGGRLVIPVGPDASSQVLLHITRQARGDREEVLGEVHFVPLVGEQGFREDRSVAYTPGKSGRSRSAPLLVREVAEPLVDADSPSPADGRGARLPR